MSVLVFSHSFLILLICILSFFWSGVCQLCLSTQRTSSKTCWFLYYFVFISLIFAFVFIISWLCALTRNLFTVNFMIYCIVIRDDTRSYFDFFLIWKFFFVSQYVAHFREVFVCLWIDNVFFGIWVKYFVNIY